MLKNYFLTAIRNFSKSALHISMNVIGLGIGIAMCIMAFLFNAFNSEFNKEYDKDETNKIYRLEYTNLENDENVLYGSVDVRYTWFLDDNIPGIEAVLRMYGRRATVKSDEFRFSEYMNFCNKELLQSFPFELVEGSILDFNNPEAVYLSQEVASKYFGEKPAVNKALEIQVKDSPGGIQNFIVKGIFRNGKANSSYGYIDILTNFENLNRVNNVSKENPLAIAAETFIKISNDEVINNPVILSRLKENTSAKLEKGEVNFRFTPFSKIHKSSGDRVRLTFSNNDITRNAVLTFNLLGLMILLIACFNYTIFAFSSAGKRLKEIGVRKVTGGNRKQIIIQFMLESLIMSIISLLVGLLLAQFIIPLFDNIWDGLPYNISDIGLVRLIIFLVSVTLLMAFIAGFYPALYVSRFNPTAILAKNTKLKKTGWITYSLVLFQQVITIIGLGASIIFTENIYWVENMDYGYDKDNLLTIQGLNATEKSDVFVELVKQHPKVVSSGMSWKMLGNGTGDRKVTINGKEYYVDLMETGPNYLETNKVRLVSGRFWNNDSKTDMLNTALVNQRFLEVTNIKDPIGKQITLLNGRVVKIIGVVEDYKHVGPWRKTEPTVIHYPLEGNFKFLAIRGNSLEDLKEVDAYCKEQWEALEPFMPYVSMYETGNIEDALNLSTSFKKTFLFTAFIALLLSVGGMFSLVSMLVQNRTKEIAIRKTIGSNVQFCI